MPLPTNMTYYFAYGSSLNALDWQHWCELHHADATSLTPIGTAILPDMALHFGYNSSFRNGGTLNVIEHPGHLVQGVIFEVTEDGWHFLDRKEGHPFCYQRTPRTALLPDGRPLPVVTYEVVAELCQEFCQPSDAYLQCVAEGLESWQLSSSALSTASKNGSPQPAIDGIFVYGTLMSGECRHAAIASSNPQGMIPGTTPGLLYDSGDDYPELHLPANSPTDIVHGEYYSYEQVEPDLLQQLDGIEGFNGYQSAYNLYVRTIVKVTTDDRLVHPAWCYATASPTLSKKPQISSGSWRTFNQKLTTGQHESGSNPKYIPIEPGAGT